MKQKDKLYNGISVLIFGAGGRQALPMCRGFYNLGCKVTVYCHSKLDTGYLTRFSNSKILYDKGNEENEDFLNYGLRFIKSGKFDLVVPLGDHTASFLSKHKEKLKQYTKIAVNDWDVFKNVIDKTNTMRICEENDIPAPRTMFTDNPIEEIKKKKLSYPVVVKPKTGVGSIGFNIIKDEKLLKTFLANYDNANGPLLVQEYIEQDGTTPQYGAEMFRDRNGVMRAALVVKKPRWFPIEGGSTVLAVSIHNDDIKDSCIKLLDALNWNGYANFDLVWDEKERKAKILEINGRISAIVKLGFVSGIDMTRLILENELGFSLSNMLEYEDGKQTSCFLVDCLWFIKSKSRWSAKPSWFARWNIKDVVFSIDDPLPGIGFIITSFLSYSEAMRKRKRIN